MKSHRIHCSCLYPPTFHPLQGANELDLHPDRMGIDALRTLLVSTAKEAAFRKVVQATMVRDRQHGPVIELNRRDGGSTMMRFRR